MLALRVVSAGAPPSSLVLKGDHLSLGRDEDCDLTLDDPSVAVVHAELVRRGERWIVEAVAGAGDEGSGPRVEVNGTPVRRAPLEPGDRLRLGEVELRLERRPPEAASALAVGTGEAATVPDEAGAVPAAGEPAATPEATILRRVEDLETADTASDRVVASLLDLARRLLRTDSVPQVLDHAMEVAFRILPGERSHAFLLARDGEELSCVAARVKGEGTETAETGEAAAGNDGRLPAGPPVSRSLLQAVLDRRMALVTDDAAQDDRIAAGQSILVHRIRSAMLAPLWSGSRILGVLQIDTTRGIGVFTERHLELLAAVANFAAVAIERIENGRRVDRELAVRARLERYHSPGVIEDILEREEGVPEPGGRKLRPAEVTVMFADLVGFTPFCAASEPAVVVELLGEFFDEAVAAVFEAGGTLDKFLGDSVMAFFGAPVAQPDFAQRAVGAAIRLRRRMGEINRRRRDIGRPALDVRIAMASGPVMVGEVGSSQRVDYTVLGDTVNLASRLEGVAEAGEVVLDLRTVELLEGTIPTRPTDTVELRGLGRKVRLHSLVD